MFDCDKSYYQTYRINTHTNTRDFTRHTNMIFATKFLNISKLITIL